MNKILLQDIDYIINQNLPYSKLENKTILISGANGFIPSYIVRVLLALKTVKVIGLVRNKEKALIKFKDCLNNPNFKITVQDVSEKIEIKEKIDYIIHAASQASPKYYGIDPVGTLKANTLGTANMLDLAVKNKIQKFLFISTGEVYGTVNDKTPVLTETYTGNVDPVNIRSCYAESKRMGENMCVCYSHQYGIPVNMVRLSHTYGFGVQLDDGRVFGDFVKNIINNEDISLNSDGSAKRSFCYITDMIIGLFYVLFFGEDKNAYNIASEKETSILELAECLISLYPDKKLKIKFKKDVFQKGYIKSPSSRANFDTSKLKSLGWKQTIDIKEGFRRMIESYK